MRPSHRSAESPGALSDDCPLIYTSGACFRLTAAQVGVLAVPACAAMSVGTAPVRRFSACGARGAVWTTRGSGTRAALVAHGMLEISRVCTRHRSCRSISLT